jgi:hypothetical protein
LPWAPQATPLRLMAAVHGNKYYSVQNLKRSEKISKGKKYNKKGKKKET